MAVLFNFAALVSHPAADVAHYSQPANVDRDAANSNATHAQVHSQWKLGKGGRLESRWEPDAD
jgi:hypothetical protein